MSAEKITIRMVSAEEVPAQQNVSVKKGATVGEVLAAHPWWLAYAKKYPGTAVVGIFGQLVAMDQVLQEGDRLELYLPLHHEPMLKRRLQSRK